MTNSHDSADEIHLKPEEANDVILSWGFNEVAEYLVYSRRMEMENPQYIVENINLTGIVHSHSGWRWTKTLQYNGFEYKVDIFENCKFVKEGQEIAVLWNDDKPDHKEYRVQMKPVGMTKGIISSLYSIDSHYYKYDFFSKFANDIFSYRNDIIKDISELHKVINSNCKVHAVASYNHIRADDLKQIKDFVNKLLEIKEDS